MKIIFQSLRLYLALTLLTGIVYPLALTGVAQSLFPNQATGSRIVEHDKLVGSDLIAQKFENPKYFWPRPSTAEYATVASGASNKGPTSSDLRKAIETRREKFGMDAPIDLLTASSSGLDPHVSPEAARTQISRVALARNESIEKISALVEQVIEPSQFGVFGEPRVNVLRLNRALDLMEQIPATHP